MAGIAVPVIVHLWNDRRGNVLQVGSIELLAGSKRRPAWRPRITQWWLLVVRCLLVTAMALLLAGPYWMRHAGGKGWVLADGGFGLGAGGGGKLAGMIDSLVKAGYQRHGLSDTINYWEAFREADAEAPGGVSLYLITTGLSQRFSGSRPVSRREVHWYTYTPDDSVENWVQAAWRDSGDVVVLKGESRSTGTRWARERADWGLAPAAIDTAVVRYRIVADGVWRGDAKYVRAALEALRETTRRPIMEGDGGWLFWLSERSLPSTGGYSRVFCYAKGTTLAVDTRMEGVLLTKEVAGVGVGSALWKDGFGKGVLVRDGKMYRFFSRLDPGWSDLVWSGRWPVLLKGLLLDEIDAGRHDRRLLDPGQVAPLHVERSVGNMAADLARMDLRPVVWGMVFILFLLERIIAYKNERRKA